MRAGSLFASYDSTDVAANDDLAGVSWSIAVNRTIDMGQHDVASFGDGVESVFYRQADS